MEETELTMSVSSRKRSNSTAHSTGVSDSGRWSTRRIAMYALFAALTMAVSFIEFPIIPGVQWLEYDPSGIVCLIAGFALGPSAAAIVSVIGALPHLFITPWGALMAILVSLAMSVPASIVYRKSRTAKGALAGVVLGADHHAGRGADRAGAAAVQPAQIHDPWRRHDAGVPAGVRADRTLSSVIRLNL